MEEDEEHWGFLTWTEFKKFIDHKLEQLGVSGDDYTIEWIDIGMPRYDDTRMSINRESRTISIWG